MSVRFTFRMSVQMSAAHGIMLRPHIVPARVTIVIKYWLMFPPYGDSIIISTITKVVLMYQVIPLQFDVLNVAIMIENGHCLDRFRRRGY